MNKIIIKRVEEYNKIIDELEDLTKDLFPLNCCGYKILKKINFNKIRTITQELQVLELRLTLAKGVEFEKYNELTEEGVTNE